MECKEFLFSAFSTIVLSTVLRLSVTQIVMRQSIHRLQTCTHSYKSHSQSCVVPGTRVHACQLEKCALEFINFEEHSFERQVKPHFKILTSLPSYVHVYHLYTCSLLVNCICCILVVCNHWTGLVDWHFCANETSLPACRFSDDAFINARYSSQKESCVQVYKDTWFFLWRIPRR